MRSLGIRGFSLTELMIAMGLLGGISIFTMKMVEEQKGNETYLRGQGEVAKALLSIQGTLGNKDNCKKMLQGRTLGPVSQLVLNGKVLIQAPKDYPDYSVDAIRLENLLGTTLNPSTTNGLLANLSIDFSIKKRSLLSRLGVNNEDKITKQIAVMVTVNGSGQVVDCGPLIADANTEAERKMCESLGLGEGAVWDSATNTCVMRSFECPPDTLPKRLNSMGSMVCEPALNQLELERIFDTNGVNCSGYPQPALSVQLVGGRLKVVCTP